MALRKIASLARYAQILKQNPEEAKSSRGRHFIHVTSFFRDPECFEALENACWRSCAGTDRRTIRCASGSPAAPPAKKFIPSRCCCSKSWANRPAGPRFRSSAPISRKARWRMPATASTGEAAVAGVSPARLKRFLFEAENGHQIRKFVRDLCVFARHDLAQDPAFSRLDLISCRNVLIYMGAALQKRVLSIFQYALKPGGFLFLGQLGIDQRLLGYFRPRRPEHRIFVRKTPTAVFRGYDAIPEQLRPVRPCAARDSPGAGIDFRKEAESVLLEHYMPPALIVDPDLQIVHFQGDVSPYLAPATGQPSFHLLKMVRPELVIDLRAAIQKALKENLPVRKDRVQFEHQGQAAEVRIEVRPFRARNGKKRDFWSYSSAWNRLGRRGQKESLAGKNRPPTKRSGWIANWRPPGNSCGTLIAEHETAQEEMKAANEEILASNEELQSTNEELETARGTAVFQRGTHHAQRGAAASQCRADRSDAGSEQSFGRYRNSGARSRRRIARKAIHASGRCLDESHSGRYRAPVQQHCLQP